MRIASVVFLLGFLVANHALAFPELFTCSAERMQAGEECDCSPMFIQRFSAVTAAGECVITAPETYEPCTTYVIELNSNGGRGHKIFADGGGVLNSSPGTSSHDSDGKCRGTTGSSQVKKTLYSWTAPADNTATQTFSALCGFQGSVFAANRVSPLANSSAPTFPTGCPTTCFGPGCDLGSFASISSTLSISVFSAICVALVTFIL